MVCGDTNPRSFRGKLMFVVLCLVLTGGYVTLAAVLIAFGLVPAGITLLVIAGVGCPLFLWYCWRD